MEMEGTNLIAASQSIWLMSVDIQLSNGKRTTGREQKKGIEKLIVALRITENVDLFNLNFPSPRECVSFYCE